MSASAAANDEAIPVREVRFVPCVRLVPSRFPPVSLFDRVADAADLDAVFAIEALTNDRLRDEVGEISLVPRDERVVGPGSTPIMAAFTHPNREGSRFSDGTWGVYYAGESLRTAVAEVAYHRARFLARTAEPPLEIDLRAYLADVEAPMHDLRGEAARFPDVYASDDYSASQALAARLRAAGSTGIAYTSVRRPDGECIAVFRPRALARCRQNEHVAMVWDGQRIAHWYVKSALRAVPPARAGARDG